jgi:hypothetical protein
MLKSKGLNGFILGYPFALLASLFFISILYFVFGLYWEESMKIISAIIYGSISAPPYQVWFDESFLFQPPIFAFLSAHIKGIPVLGLWHFALVLLYTSVFLHLSVRLLSRFIPRRPFFVAFFSLLLICTFISTSLIYIHLGREAILIMSTSLLLFFDYYQTDKKKPKVLIVSFFIGCLMRVSLGVFVLSAISFLAFLYTRDLKKTLLLFRLHWLLAMACLSIILIYKFYSNNPAVVIEQTYEYALMDRGAIVPLSEMRSAGDTIRYEALTRYFLISDSAQISLNFIKQVVDKSKFLKFGVTHDDWDHMLGILPLFREKSTDVALFYLILIIAAYGRKRAIVNLILFHTFCWLVVLALCMKISMYERFLLPWLAMMFIGSLLVLSFEHIVFSGRQKYSMLMILLFTSFGSFNKMKALSKEEKGYNEKALNYLNKIGKVSATQTPFIWDYTQVCFPSEIFAIRKLQVFEKSMYQTSFFMTFYRFGQERCLKKFGFSPLDCRNMGLTLKKRKQEVCFIMGDEIAEFLPRYYKAIYNIDFILIRDAPQNEIMPGVFVFHLK